MSDDVAIEVEGLGKRFEIGASPGGYQLLTETLTQRVKSLGRRPPDARVLGASRHRLRGEAR